MFERDLRGIFAVCEVVTRSYARSRCEVFAARRRNYIRVNMVSSARDQIVRWFAAESAKRFVGSEVKTSR